MGPVIFITGNLLRQHETRPVDPASMGPVIFITGNGLPESDGRVHEAVLQWGR